jgi:hypothetical protein
VANVADHSAKATSGARSTHVNTPVVNALRTVQLDRDITLFLLRLVDHAAIADCLRQVGMVQKHVSRIEVSRLGQQGE